MSPTLVRHIAGALAALLLVSLTACATVIHGTRQDVGISSSPSGATVRIDGTDAGTTPLIVPLARRSSHVVSVTADGYAPCETTVTRTASGWVWGNLVVGGVVGFVVDASSGGLWNLEPDSDSCALRPAP